MEQEQGQGGSGEARTDGAGRRMDLGLLAVSACVLTLQVLQTKIFASLEPSFAERSLVSIAVLVALVLPYLCFGFVIALLLVARSAAIGRAYTFNLAGSGLGRLIVFPLLDSFGAERALIGVALLLAPAAGGRSTCLRS